MEFGEENDEHFEDGLPLSFSGSELAEGFQVLLEIRNCKVVHFALFQKLVDLHSRFETQKPAKLSGGKRTGPVCFKRKTFKCGPVRCPPAVRT